MKIDARARTADLDRRADQWTAEKLHRTFLGRAVVRRAIDRAMQARVKEAIDVAYPKKSGFQVHDPDIATASGDWVSGWRSVDTPLLQDFLTIAFAGQDWRPSHVATRRVKVVESSRERVKPLELHRDSLFQLQLYCQFMDARGPLRVDAPSLQLVPLNYRRGRAYSRYAGKVSRENEKYHPGDFRPDIVDLDATAKTFGRNCFLQPERTPGNVIVLSNWIVHGTCWTRQPTSSCVPSAQALNLTPGRGAKRARSRELSALFPLRAATMLAACSPRPNRS